MSGALACSSLARLKGLAREELGIVLGSSSARNFWLRHELGSLRLARVEPVVRVLCALLLKHSAFLILLRDRRGRAKRSSHVEKPEVSNARPSV